MNVVLVGGLHDGREIDKQSVRRYVWVDKHLRLFRKPAPGRLLYRKDGRSIGSDAVSLLYAGYTHAYCGECDVYSKGRVCRMCARRLVV